MLESRALFTSALNARTLGLPRVLLLGLAFFVLVGCVRRTRPPDAIRVTAEAHPAVVLLIRQLEDGKYGFGAGVVIEPGLVLTNQHVADDAVRLLALRYRADRTSYIAADGGLGRYVFEHESEVLPAEMVLADPINDLALVRIDDPSGGWSTLPIRHEPVEPGEPVFAIGHPQFNPWTLTAGRVSALPHGFIQHDAPLSPGNSGGPLLDAEGRLIGVNTRKLFGDAEGIGYARPLSLARIFWAGAPNPVAIDQHTPKAAWHTFLAAYERGLPETGELVSEDSRREWMRVLANSLVEDDYQQIMKLAHDDLKAHGFDLHDLPKKDLVTLARVWKVLRQKAPDLSLRAAPGIPRRGRLVGPSAQPDLSALPDLGPLYTKLGLAAIAFEMATPPTPMLGRLAATDGIRIAAVQPDGPDGAWVLLEGRMADGTVQRATARSEREGTRWSSTLMLTPSQAKQRPEGWPPPLLDRPTMASTLAVYRVNVVASLLVVASLGAFDDEDVDEEDVDEE